MGLPVPAEAATSTDHSGLDDSEEPENEDESVIHHTASTGDVEVHSNNLFCFFHMLHGCYSSC